MQANQSGGDGRSNSVALVESRTSSGRRSFGDPVPNGMKRPVPNRVPGLAHLLDSTRGRPRESAPPRCNVQESLRPSSSRRKQGPQLTVSNLEAIVREAIAKSPAEAARYLEQICSQWPEARTRIEALIEAMERARVDADGRLPTIEASEGDRVENVTVTAEPSELFEGAGAVVGPYKLLQKLGEGGMGSVYMAEQELPVRRKVAVKVIKPGMDGKLVIARFEAERQALAILDHPNIAKVFDAGETAAGRPYFAMELVKGEPITQYCDRNLLSPRERLELFIPVCGAIQHAHQKGIIHRDIKPSNVLVTIQDGALRPRSSISESPRRSINASPTKRCSPSSGR